MNTSRFPNNPGRDNTDRIFNNLFLEPVYAANIAIVTNKARTLVKPGTLTGAVTFTANVGDATNPPCVGDTMQFLLAADAGGARVATFGTGFAPSATLSVTASKKAYIDFMFDGAVWIETSRTVTA